MEKNLDDQLKDMGIPKETHPLRENKDWKVHTIKKANCPNCGKPLCVQQNYKVPTDETTRLGAFFTAPFWCNWCQEPFYSDNIIKNL